MRKRINLAVMGRRLEKQQMEELTRAHEERARAGKGPGPIPDADYWCDTFCSVTDDKKGEHDFFYE